MDIAFYRIDGMKLFAIQSDKILGVEQSGKKGRWIFDFEIADTGLSSQPIYFDGGVRSDFHQEYPVLWQRVRDLFLYPGPRGDLVTVDSYASKLSCVENLIVDVHFRTDKADYLATILSILHQAGFKVSINTLEQLDFRQKSKIDALKRFDQIQLIRA